MRRTESLYPAVDAEKEQLKKELRKARRALFDLMPENVQQILHSYRQCKSSEEGRFWRHKAINELVDIAEPLPPKTYASLGRGICPMCRRGPNSAYYEGFTLPEGLRRHLDGYGNTQMCDVFSVLLSDIGEKLHEMFDEADRIKSIEKKEITNKRMATEVLYKIGPESDPILIDDLFHSKCRDNEELQFAEERIVKLGFTITNDDRVKSYSLDYGDVVVYADPRQQGRITFYVYIAKWEVAKKKKSARRPRQDFYIPDTWKHNIRDKYDTRLVEARKWLGLSTEIPTQTNTPSSKKKKR